MVAGAAPGGALASTVSTGTDWGGGDAAAGLSKPPKPCKPCKLPVYWSNMADTSGVGRGGAAGSGTRSLSNT